MCFERVFHGIRGNLFVLLESLHVKERESPQYRVVNNSFYKVERKYTGVLSFVCVYCFVVLKVYCLGIVFITDVNLRVSKSE